MGKAEAEAHLNQAKAIISALDQDTPFPRMVRGLQSSVPDNSRLDDRRVNMFRIARYSGPTAAALLLYLFAVWFGLTGRSGGVAFADVIENVRKVRSATCRNTQKLGGQAENNMGFLAQRPEMDD